MTGVRQRAAHEKQATQVSKGQLRVAHAALWHLRKQAVSAPTAAGVVVGSNL